LTLVKEIASRSGFVMVLAP